MLLLAFVPASHRCWAGRDDDDDKDERSRRRIGITREQQRRIEALYKKTDGDTRPVRERLKEMQRQLDRLYDAYDFDRGLARNLGDQIAAQQRRLLTIRAENEESLRRILDRKQFGRLRDELRRREKRDND